MAKAPNLYAHLRGEPLQPVYTLLSTEPALLSEAVDALRGKVLTAAPDFNRDELRVGEGAIQRAFDAAWTLPMMATMRWVHLCDIDKLKAKDTDALLAYLAAPSRSSVLCLSGTKLDGRTKAGQQLRKQTAVFTLDVPRQHEMGRWLQSRAGDRGIEIEPDAAGLLADLLGSDVGSIDRSLDKLWTYIGAEGAITLADVETGVAPTRVHSIFDLTDAIGDRDLGKASLLLRNAIDGGEAALRVLAMITRQFRLLLKVKRLGSGASPATIAREVGVAPFAVDRLVRQARRYSPAELSAALVAAAAADMRIKSTRLHPGVVLDRLLVEAMGSKAA